MPGPAPKSQGSRRRRNRPPAGTTAIVPIDPEILALGEEIAKKEADGEVVEAEVVLPVMAKAQLPVRPDGEHWHRMAIACFEDIRRSALASQIAQPDLHLLLLLLDMVHNYWTISPWVEDPDTGKQVFSPEIARLKARWSDSIGRLTDQFGIGPKARKSLAWISAEAEAAEDRTQQRRSSRQQTGVDPRTLY